jgi:hypothetical protein
LQREAIVRPAVPTEPQGQTVRARES